jgi:hypothetical protein
MHTVNEKKNRLCRDKILIWPESVYVSGKLCNL